MNATEKRARELSRAVMNLSKSFPEKKAQKPRSLDFLTKLTGVKKNTKIPPKPVPQMKVVEKKVYMGEPGTKGEQGLKGDKGERGNDGKDAVTPQKGVDYFTAQDIETLKREFLTLIPKIPEKESFQITDEMVKEIIQRMQKLPEQHRLEIQGIRNFQSFVYKGKKYGVEELMHGGGSSTATSAVLVPTGTVNGVNTIFLFATAPNIIALDNGNFMNKVSVDGTINWTGTTAVTVNQAPLFNIFGL